MQQPHAYFYQLLQKPNLKIALVGATNHPQKYGNIILKNLTSKGYTVFPINPRARQVEGITTYPSLSSLPQKPELINFVVPAKIGITILKQAIADGLDNFWFQPGAEDPAILELLSQSGRHYLADGSCIMVMSPKRDNFKQISK